MSRRRAQRFALAAALALFSPASALPGDVTLEPFVGIQYGGSFHAVGSGRASIGVGLQYGATLDVAIGGERWGAQAFFARQDSELASVPHLGVAVERYMAGVREEKGCPKKYTMVVVTKERIEIKKQIKFATGSAKIVGAESEKILDEVALALKDNAQIKKVRVEGHTDSVGDDSKNLKLSQNRANSVMSALIKRGVDPARMEALGFGETKPIASNSTSAGKAENRRTEFNIAEQ